VNAVRVEDDLGTPHREREVETTADRQHPGQLPDGLARPQRVDGVAIATQTDVLRDMQARDRGELQVSKGERKDVAGARFQILHRSGKRSHIEEHYFGDAGQTRYPSDLSSDVHVSLGPVRNDLPEGPSPEVHVVSVEPGCGRLIFQHRPQ